MLAILLALLLLPALARDPDDTTLQALCERGDHDRSASACGRLAERHRGGPGEAPLRLAQGRLVLSECRGQRMSASCREAVGWIWRHNPDPAEVRAALGELQADCAGSPGESCRLAAAAAWLGHGTSVDPLGAIDLQAAVDPGPWDAWPTIWEATAPHGWRRDPVAIARALSAEGGHGDVLALPFPSLPFPSLPFCFDRPRLWRGGHGAGLRRIVGL